jgi:pyruvate dehydrogenase E2 component (dihydrolipoamide acetyltransferase)
MPEFAMPSLGADMDEGTLLEWLVKPGDVVHRGDVVAVVDTAKAAMDVEIFQDGVIEKLIAEPGTTLPVGAPLAVIGGEGAAATPEAPAAVRVPTLAPPSGTGLLVESPLVRHRARELGVDLANVVGSGPGGVITRADVDAHAAAAPQVKPKRRPPIAIPAQARPPVSPFARRRAAELGVDLGVVQGSGPGGAIIAVDVERAAARPTPVAAEPGAPQREPAAPVAPDMQAKARAMRKAIGQLMARSKREIPHYYLSTTIDLTVATDWLHQANLDRPLSSRLVPAVLLLKASARAIRDVPEMNGFWLDDEFVPGPAVHLGVAISLRQGGLIAPAIHHADNLTLDELMEHLRDLVSRARAGRLKQSEMDPTITVTNLGDQGVDSVHGVIYPPQVALVGFGKVAERPWADGGMLGVRTCVTATLAADHRASDGHRGGLYLAAIDSLLRKPEEL